MAENHLEYGYLEGESIGEHFAEDPVGIDENVAVAFVLFLARTSVGRANDDDHVEQKQKKNRYAV